MGTFDDIMSILTPERIIQVTQIQHDDARGRFGISSPLVKSYAEFVQRITAYVIYHQQAAFGGPPMPPDMAWGKAGQILEKLFKGGINAAVMTGLSGDQGGMRFILDTICEGYKQESENNYITFILDSYLDPLDFDQIVQAMTEFKATLSQYAPASFKAIDPAGMAADYNTVVRQYIQSLRQYGNLRKYY